MHFSSSLTLLLFMVLTISDFVLSRTPSPAENNPSFDDAQAAQLQDRAFIPFRPEIPHDIPEPPITPSEIGAGEPPQHIGEDPVDPRNPTPTETIHPHIGEDPSEPAITPSAIGGSARPTATEAKSESEPEVETPDVGSSTGVAASQTGTLVRVVPTATSTTTFTTTNAMPNQTQGMMLGDASGSHPSSCWVGAGAMFALWWVAC